MNNKIKRYGETYASTKVHYVPNILLLNISTIELVDIVMPEFIISYVCFM